MGNFGGFNDMVSPYTFSWGAQVKLFLLSHWRNTSVSLESLTCGRRMCLLIRVPVFLPDILKQHSVHLFIKIVLPHCYSPVTLISAYNIYLFLLSVEKLWQYPICSFIERGSVLVLQLPKIDHLEIPLLMASHSLLLLPSWLDSNWSSMEIGGLLVYRRRKEKPFIPAASTQ